MIVPISMSEVKIKVEVITFEQEERILKNKQTIKRDIESNVVIFAKIETIFSLLKI